MKASDIMTTDVVTVDSLATIEQATKIMQQHKVKTLIVERSSPLDAYGIITATDVSRAIANGKNPNLTYVSEVMTKPCIVVNPNLAVEHIVKLFAQAKIRIAPVIKDQLLGVVSLTDILTKTNSLNDRQMPEKTSASSALPELASDQGRDQEWETVDWESEYENWCSG